jgi:hypothetical protein
MITTTQAQIQATATVESLSNPIDRLAVIDRQIKALTTDAKGLKDGLANTLGEGKHRGEQYGVRITIEQRKGSIDLEALCKAFGITVEQAEQFRGDAVAVIKVASIS